ncbi:MAG: anthranilate phosphoribosyltransferase [Anaerolineae bacterium]|nr:anthranilate phosphoribosyltransferase [Gemmatimonadaceae bacterium]
MSGSALHTAIRQLAGSESLTAEDTAAAFDVVMRGEATAAQVAALLMGLRVKGETAQEVTGGAQALRKAMVRLPAENPDELVDTCGTGGGRVPTFNISTAAALLAAGAGVRVAKHGNRSFTSSCGSADVLEALGVRIELTPEAMARVLTEAGIVFMFAPLMHPAMRHVGPVRRELAIPTLMNVLGPLANPAGAGRQVVGVADEARMPLLAGALAALGSVHALVVHGEPGMDELSPIGVTRMLEVRGGNVTPMEVRPSDLGIPQATAAELMGGDPAANAIRITEILENRSRDGGRAAVILNAGAALYVAGAAHDLPAGVESANRALGRGEGIRALERLREASAKEQ